ncbi:MAG: TonB-dependent receptor [Bacteroidota bacterium]
MKTPFHFLLLLLICCPLWSSAQKEVTISGYVKDKESGETLIGATIFSNEHNAGTVTNSYGFYSLTIPAGECTLEFSYMGYERHRETIEARSGKTLNIELAPESIELGAVDVKARADDHNIKSTQMSMVQMDAKTLKKLPVIFGESDLMKSVQMMPGIQTPVEGSSGFSVRGGAMDQNLILLDEATVYNPSHLMGFFSVFNSDAIKDVSLYKGDIPASSGGRLSSLLDIQMKDGSKKEFGAEGGLGLISSRLTLEGPIEKDKGSFIISGRRTYADMFLKLSSDSAINNNKLFFYDLNTKLNYKINDNNRVFLSGYFGNDAYGYDDQMGMNWGNATFTARWNHLFTDRLFSNLTLLYSKYNYQVEMKDGSPEFDWTSNLENLSAKYDFSFHPSPVTTFKFGGEAIRHFIQPGRFKVSGRESDFKVSNNKAMEYGAYLLAEQKIGEKLKINAGLRFSAFQNIGKATVYRIDEDYQVSDTVNYKNNKAFNTYMNWEPRFSARYLINNKNSLKTSYSRTNQYIQLASNSTAGTPLDVWFPASEYVKPQVCDQISAGWFRNFENNKYEASLEVFHKWMDNQIDFHPNANLMLNNQLEKEIRFGKGHSYGTELLLRKNEGDMTGWIGYTWSKARRNFPDINEGKEYPAHYDIPHNLNIVLNYQISKRVGVSSNWTYRTGAPITYPTMRFRHANSSLPIYGEKNSSRLPDYHRLDLSVTIKGKDKPDKKWKGEWHIGAYNAYNRANAYSVQFEDDPETPNKINAYKTVMFKIVPSVTYNFKF